MSSSFESGAGAFVARRMWFRFAIVVCALLPTALAQAAEPAPARERLSFNADWRFQKGDPAGAEGQLEYQKIKDWITATGNEFVLNPDATKPNRPASALGAEIAYAQRNFDDRAWRRLNLPHDWGIEGPFKQEYPGETGKLPWWGVGWYRKHFTVAESDKGKQIYLDIDGAMAYSAVWLNGKFVGGWPYGYVSFRLDLTPYIAFGVDNTLAIRLDNPPDSSRWYPGGGVYRNVWLVKTAPVHVGHWGTYVTTPEVAPSAATVAVKVTLENHSPSAATVNVKTQVYELGADGKKTGNQLVSTPIATLKIPAGESQFNAAKLSVKNPKLWNLQKPNLYVAVTTVEQRGKVVDSYE